MSQLLSTDEVDALLRGVVEGAVPLGGPVRTAHVAAIDLGNEERNLRGRHPNLELAVDRFARAVRTTFGAILGKLPTSEPTALELVKIARVSARFVPPVSAQLFRMPPLDGQGMIIVPPRLAALLFEGFLGGDARRRTPLPARGFSPIEQRVLERFGRRVVQDLGEAWQPLARMEFSFVGSEYGATLTVLAAPQDVVLLIELAIGVEADEPLSLGVCLPSAALDAIRRALPATPGGAREVRLVGWSDRMRELLAPTEVELVAELGTQRMRLADVLALRVGDVLTLRTGREGPVLVRVEGRPVFVGAPGLSGSSNAVRITATV